MYSKLDLYAIMFTVMDMQKLKAAWAKSPIDFQQQQAEFKGGIINSVSSDGVHIAIISMAQFNDERYCTILWQDLSVYASFLLPSSIETVHHVFTKTRGLVQGDYEGGIHITKFEEQKPKPPIVASRGLLSRVTSLTTKGDIIAAGSIQGEFGVWSYDGIKLYKTDMSQHLHSISIRQDKLMLASDNHIRELKYKAHERELNLLEVEVLRNVDIKSSWASFDLEGVQIVCGTNTSTYESYRPVFPESATNLDIYHLSTAENFETGFREITIREFLTREIVRESPCKRIKDIKKLWCDCERIYLISQRAGTIYMIDFAKDIRKFDRNASFKTMECFSLGDPIEW
ncbi:hypothetical protein B0O99DRAFT_695222 [Bisporella sp. PMI_857]|nr:hypothetical protein B0O99DRAFT_695222 [Bisporella sp. PMI_857]